MRKLSYKWPVWMTIFAFSMPGFYIFFRIGKPQIFHVTELVEKVVGAVFITIIVWLGYGVACLFASPVSETSEERIEEEGNS